MKKSKKVLIIAVVAIVLVIVAVVLAVVFLGKGKNAYRLVKAQECEGSVSLERKKEEKMDVFNGMQLVSEDTVSVGEDSQLVLLLDSDKHMVSEENTKFKLVATGSEKKGKVEIILLEGSTLISIEEKLNDDSTFEVVTPNAVMSVRGTTFKVGYDKTTGESTLEVADGVVELSYDGGAKSKSVKANEGYTVSGKEAEPMDAISISMQDLPDFGSQGNENGQGGEDAKEQGQSQGGAPDVEIGGEFDVTVENNDEAINSQYAYICAHMEDFVKGVERLRDEYDSYDYMVYDYNQDGKKEVILYLRYFNDEHEMMLDLAYLYYDAKNQKVGVFAVNNSDADDNCFYGDYQGKLARYSWRTSPYESYLYVVEVREDKLIYVLESAYDYVSVDYENEIGIKALPLYGYWEIPILEDDTSEPDLDWMQ